MKYLLMTVLLLSFNAESAKMYKWVDENGKVHYSDRVPPDQVKHARQELSAQGVVKEEVDRALTPEERAARAAEIKQQKELEEQKRLEVERLEAERKQLLRSYSSADQIKRLKSERINALQRNIQMAEENLVIQQKNEQDLMRRAADKERSGEVVSDNFLNQMQQVKDQIEYQKQFIIDKTAEIETTKTKYDHELAKYLEYTEGHGQSDS
ncbi:DUF4124 domain-containing protein [Marinicella sediminis]|uniref:DUF4124 domain-containing protein n=2 Tax=Marinicella sediminis TaxID=1792834 RepID=A0ABV7JHD6_9GAMM|nr:DUF4124 domain-containing protein [Marinicella sediminis]